MPLPQPGDALLDFVLGPARAAAVKMAQFPLSDGPPPIDQPQGALLTGPLGEIRPTASGSGLAKPLGHLPQKLQIQMDRRGAVVGEPRLIEESPGSVKPRTMIDPLLREQPRLEKGHQSPPGFIDRNWPYLLGGAGAAGLGYLGYRHFMNRSADEDETKRADAVYDTGVQAGHDVNDWMANDANRWRAEQAAAQTLGGVGLVTPMAMALRGGYSAATAPKGYFLQSALRGAGIGAGAGLGATAAGVGHTLFGGEQDIGTNLALRAVGGLAGGYGASKLLGEHPADRDKREEEARRAAGTDEASMRQKFLEELLAGRKTAQAPGVTVLPTVNEPGNAITRFYNDSVAGPVNNYATSRATEAGATAGAAGQQSFADRMGLGSIASNPYVIGGGLGALAGGGLSLLGGVGSKRKKKDRLVDAGTGALLGAGAGLLGGGLYSMWNQGRTPQTPTSPAAPTPPPPAVARTEPGNTNPGGLTARTPQPAAQLGSNTVSGSPLEAGRQLFSSLGRLTSNSGKGLEYKQNLDTVDSGAAHLHRAATSGGNLEDARALDEAYGRAQAAQGTPGEGLANADYAAATRMLAERMAGPPETAFDRPGGATAQATAAGLARQVQNPVSAAAGGVIPTDNHQYAGPSTTAEFPLSPGTRSFLEGTAAAGTARGLVSAARQATVGRPTSASLADRAGMIRDRVTPKPVVQNVEEGVGPTIARIRNTLVNGQPPTALGRAAVGAVRGPIGYALGGTAPRWPDYSGMSANDLLGTPGMEAATARAAAGMPQTGRPITLDTVRRSLQRPGSSGTMAQTQLNDLFRQVQEQARTTPTPRPTPSPGTPGLARAGTVSSAGNRLAGLGGRAAGVAGNAAKMMVNPRNWFAGGVPAVLSRLGRNATPTTPAEDLLGLRAGGLDPYEQLVPRGRTLSGLASGVAEAHRTPAGVDTPRTESPDRKEKP